MAGMITRAAFNKLKAMVKGCRRPSKTEAARDSDCIIASDLDQVVAQPHSLGGFQPRNPDVGRMSPRRVQNQPAAAAVASHAEASQTSARGSATPTATTGMSRLSNNTPNPIRQETRHKLTTRESSGRKSVA